MYIRINTTFAWYNYKIFYFYKYVNIDFEDMHIECTVNNKFPTCNTKLIIVYKYNELITVYSEMFANFQYEIKFAKFSIKKK